MIYTLIFTVVCPTASFETHQEFDSWEEANEERLYAIENPYEEQALNVPNQCYKTKPRILAEEKLDEPPQVEVEDRSKV